MFIYFINYMNFADLNPAINYNNLQPINAKQSGYNQYAKCGDFANNLTNFNNYDNFDNFDDNKDTENFYKSQSGISNVKKNESYYCEKNASIANKHLRLEKSPLASLYYSQENVERIQKQIRREIYKRTNGKFKVLRDSDESDMQVVMDSIFDDHAKHLPDQLVRQVKILNMHTVNLVVPNAITQIDQTSKYLKQLDKPIEPMNRPLNANNGGRKTLPSFTSVLGF